MDKLLEKIYIDATKLPVSFVKLMDLTDQERNVERQMRDTRIGWDEGDRD